MGLRSALGSAFNAAEAIISTAASTTIKGMSIVEDALDQAQLELKSLKRQRAQELTAEFKRILSENPTLKEDLTGSRQHLHIHNPAMGGYFSKNMSKNILDYMTIPAVEKGLVMPYIIAEAGVNHEGSMELARRLIREAKAGGADAIKFQTYRADTLASKDSPAYWDTSKEPTKSQYELFKKHDTFWKNEFEQLKRACDDEGIAFMSTPFDMESARFLAPLMDVFKISSSDITNRPFIEFLCDFGKPVLLSTGASDLHEVAEAVEWITDKGVPLCLLHCVLNYPTMDENAALGMIRGLRLRFPDLAIGYSDHTLPDDMHILTWATLLGARVLEKHFTFDKTLPGNDHYHAMDKKDLAAFIENMKKLLTCVGDYDVRALPSEAPARRNARRSLVAARSIAKGTALSREDLTWKRPAHGISPRCIDEVLGMVARDNIPEDTVLQWTHLDRA